MDKPNSIRSSEDMELESEPNNIDEINETVTPNAESDHRINCTDKQSLRSIWGVALNQIEELADTCNLGDSRSDFITVFSESFKNALQENILVNGLPLMIDDSTKLSSPEKKDHSTMVDDVLFGKLSKRVANVASERKLFPEQCRRVLNIEMKHELQNLKKAKVIDSSEKSTSIVSALRLRKAPVKQFTEFCQGFGTMQQTVQCKLQEKEKLKMKLSLIKQIKKSQNSSNKTTTPQ